MFQTSKRIANTLPRLVRYKKSPAPRRPEKIPVQLYTDVAGLGNTGEVIRVRPAFMRNVLHRDNSAGYVMKGVKTKLDVVEKSVPVEEIQEVEIEEVIEEKKVESSAMSLNELTNLFSTMKTTRSKIRTVAQTFAASEEVGFSVDEIRKLVPAKYVLDSLRFDLPVKKTKLSEILFDFTGIEVPVGGITIRGSDGDVEQIVEKGTYVWVVTSEKRFVEIALEVV